MTLKNARHKFAILAVDIVLFTIKEDKLLVRMVKVNCLPYFKNTAGLPGGLIAPQETAEESVTRFIKDKAGIDPSKVYFEQLYTFSTIDRDPRGRVVSVGYFGLVPWESLSMTEQEDTRKVWWGVFPLQKHLAYDHDQILSLAINRLRSRITYTTLSSKLAPKKFTLTHLEKIFEIVLNQKIDKRNFRKKLLKHKIVKKLDRLLRGVKYRPANLYSFVSLKVIEITIL